MLKPAHPNHPSWTGPRLGHFSVLSDHLGLTIPSLWMEGNFPNEKETQREATAQRSQAQRELPNSRLGRGPTRGPHPPLLLFPNQQAASNHTKLIFLQGLDTRVEPSLGFSFLHFTQKVLSKSLGSLSIWELSIRQGTSFCPLPGRPHPTHARPPTHSFRVQS